MTWVAIDDRFPRHPKSMAGGPLAELLQERACCYCGEWLTDGFLPKEELPNLLRGFDRLTIDGKPALEVDWPDLMVKIRVPGSHHGFWEPVEGGWIVHDYLRYNPSRKQVMERRRNADALARKGGLARARKAKRQQGRYVSDQPVRQPRVQPDVQPKTSRPAGDKLENRLANSPAGGPAGTPAGNQLHPLPLSESTSEIPEAAAGPAEPGSRDPRRRDNGSGKPKALKSIMTEEQAVRARSLIGSIESLPPKVKRFHPWAFLQKAVSQGLPVDDALKILCQIEQHWPTIKQAWAYAQEILKREYQQYRIDLAIEAHDQIKRAPPNLEAMGAIMGRMRK